jgi:hypothetical protein
MSTLGNLLRGPEPGDRYRPQGLSAAESGYAASHTLEQIDASVANVLRVADSQEPDQEQGYGQQAA